MILPDPTERVAIVSCVWQRPERLRHTLDQLAAQTCKEFLLVLINNNGELQQLVDDTVDEYQGRLPLQVIHNAENRGPYARLEQMVRLRDDFDWFVTIDDDAEFGPGWLAQWWPQRDPKAVLGWNGFMFQGNYWQRYQVNAGQECHYLWGSNLWVPVAAIDTGLLNLPRRYWQCDDLWLCFYANHVKRLKIRKASIGLSITIDGKDTYTSQQSIKPECLEWLRAKGWNV